MRLGSILEFIVSAVAGSTLGKVGLGLGAVAAVVSFILLAISVYRAWKSGKAQAKEDHDVAVAGERTHQAEVDTKLDDLAAKQAAATRIAEQETATSAALAAEYARLVAARDAAKAAVESANNWEELDAILDAPTDDKPSK